MMRAALVGGGTIVGVGVVLGLNPTGVSTTALNIPLVPAGPGQNGAPFGPSVPTGEATPQPTATPSPRPHASATAQHASRAVTSSPRPVATQSHAAPAPAPPVASPTPSPSPQSSTATGSAIDVGYGIVQVQATVKGGRLVDIQAVQVPFSDPISQQKSENAWPILVQEAIQAQSAQIAAVSGATYTSYGFAESLTSALHQLGHVA